jgi:hypothetical protein
MILTIKRTSNCSSLALGSEKKNISKIGKLSKRNVKVGSARKPADNTSI